MISYVKGILSEKFTDSVVVECGGFGVEIYVPEVLVKSLPAIGESVCIYTFFKVSEDALSLYGFLNRQDLDIFKKLISVSGIGAKTALGIMSVLDSFTLSQAIVSEDIKLISKAPGVGTKTAKRMILELKDKISTQDIIPREYASESKIIHTAAYDEVLAALVVLGYKEFDAGRAISLVEDYEDMDAESLLKQALKKLT
jgi:holliday junction DNA helicase ruvA